MRFVAVWWEDTGHIEERVPDDCSPCTVPQCSVGIEVRRTVEYIAITQSKLTDDDEQPNDGLLTIPMRCVDRVAYLVEEKPKKRRKSNA